MPTNEWLADYIRIPHVKDGRAMDGFDCWGFVVLVYDRELGIKLPSVVDGARLSVVARDEQWKKIGEDCQREHMLKLVPNTGPFEEFDILLFHVLGPTFHCGVFLDGRYYAESIECRGVSVSRFDRPGFARAHVEVYRRA